MYFPMVMDLRGKTCLIAGGGKVAFHKALLLYQFEADLKIISPEFCSDFLKGEIPFDEEIMQDNTLSSVSLFRGFSNQELSVSENTANKSVGTDAGGKNNFQHIEYIKRKIKKTDILFSDIVIAATGNKEIDTEISKVAKENNIQINVVDVPELCTFFFPAMLQEGALNISVSTSGKSPVAAAKIRDSVKENIPYFMEELIERLGEIRPMVLEKDLSHDEKKKIFSKLYEYGMGHEGKIPDEEVLESLKNLEHDTATRKCANGSFRA